MKFGINIPSYDVDWSKVIKRSRDIAKRLSKGIEYLMKKNKITYIPLRGQLLDNHTIGLSDSKKISTHKIIIATGGSPKCIPGIQIDKKIVVSSKEASPVKLNSQEPSEPISSVQLATKVPSLYRFHILPFQPSP